MKRVLVIEDGAEYSDAFGRFLSDRFTFARAGSAPQALARLAESEFDAIFLDLRFDRTPDAELVGDVASLAESRFGGDRAAARRHLVDEQGFYVLAHLRAAGVALPVLLAADLSREPRRLERMKAAQGPLDAISDVLRPKEIAARLTALTGG